MIRRPARFDRRRSGFALIAVVWVVAVVTVISMELVTSIGLEARSATARLEALKLERLALAGHEVADYLDQRGLLAAGAEISDLPVEAEIPGFTYTIRFPEGIVEIRIGAENGKVSLARASEESLAAVFTRWTGNATEGERLARRIVDWRDSDQVTASGDAEVSDYEDAAISPRNRAPGVGDTHLIAGFGAGDFGPSLIDDAAGEQWLLPEGIYSLVTPVPTDGRLNPNFAPVAVLETLPGVDASMARRIADNRPFTTLAELQQATGLLPGADTWDAVTLGAASTRTVSATAINDAGMRQMRRRTYQTMTVYNAQFNRMEPRLLIRKEQRFDTEVQQSTVE